MNRFTKVVVVMLVALVVSAVVAVVTQASLAGEVELAVFGVVAATLYVNALRRV